MSTSLAAQLQKLAVPQTSLLKRSKTRPSLLFDPREAAGLRKETVYQIGIEGLEELISKNAIFEQFTRTLFDITSKSFERAVENCNTNKKLDRHIRKFLLLLSPYFLLNCTHKTLEWLIFRYEIHDYNRESLLMLIMPYHESNIFVRVVQLMNFKDSTDDWSFLRQLQKPGVHLSKSALLAHAASSVSFLKFVSKFVFLLLKEHEKPNLLMVAFNFYCTVYAGTVEICNEIQEAQVTQMLPSLLKGLDSDIPDYCASSYVILAKLVEKVTLNDKILGTFVSKVCQVNVESLKIEAALTLIVIYQNQKHYEDVPEDACLSLSNKEWFPRILQELNKNGCRIWPLLEKLFKKNLQICVDFDSSDRDDVCDGSRKFVLGLLAAIQFDDDFVESFLCTFLDAIATRNKRTPALSDWLTSIVETVERQYPDQFDRQVYKILSSTRQGKTNKRKKSLQKIFKDAITLKSKFDVFDKLYHPNPQLRSHAVKYLVENFDRLRDGEKEMIKSSLLDRLNDSSVQVVKDTLKLLTVTKILDYDSLKPTLIGLAVKCQKAMGSKFYFDLYDDVLEVLCLSSRPDDWEAFIAVFPYLLPGDPVAMEKSKQLVKTDFLTHNPLFKKTFTEETDFDKVTHEIDFCSVLIARMENTDHDILRAMVDAVKRVPVDERDSFQKYVSSLVISSVVPLETPMEIGVSAVEIVVENFRHSDLSVEKGNGDMQKHLQSARTGKTQVEAFLFCLKSVIDRTKRPDVILTTRDFHDDNGINNYITLMCSALFKPVFNCKKYINMFTNFCCKEIQDKVTFLTNLCICQTEIFDEVFTVNCLLTIERLLNTLDDTTFLLSIDKPFVPFILVCLLNPSEKVRLGTFEILDYLTKYCQNRNEVSYYNLLKILLDQSEEIKLDVDQVSLVLSNAFLTTKKSKFIDEILDVLIDITAKSDLPLYVQSGILSCLSHVNDIKVLEKTSLSGLRVLQLPFTKPDVVKSNILTTNVSKIDKSLSAFIKLKTNAWDFIDSCLTDDTPKIIQGDRVVSPSVLLLKHLDKEFFVDLDPEVEKTLLDLLVTQATVSQNVDVLPAVAQIFKHLDLDAKTVIGHFETMRDLQSKTKKRVNVVPTVDLLDTFEWKKGMTALELIQDKKKVRNPAILVPVLFEILKKCLDFDEQTLLEYPKQLILSAILHYSAKMAITENCFNVELTVQCIRASQNPQTHHNSLLLLAESAKFAPSQVLHHIMAIFTFMGSSVLRHDDAYSFQIITKVMETVVPILITDGTMATVAKVLRVFVTVIPDVPEHRRIPLYKKLLTEIDARKNLFVFLLLVFESVATNPTGKTRTKDELNKRLVTAHELCREFPPEIVMVTCINLMKYLHEIPDDSCQKEDGNGEVRSSCGLSVHFTCPKQFRHYKYTLLGFVGHLLISTEFVKTVASLSNDESYVLERHHRDAIISVLTYAQRVTKLLDVKEIDSERQYWKAVLHRTYNILDAVNALLTPQMFLLVIKGLTQHNFAIVKRRALDILNMRLENEPNFFNECDKAELYALVPPVIKITELVHAENLSSDENVIIQTALLSLQHLSTLLIPGYEDKFKEILDYLVGLVQTLHEDDATLGSVILCLAHMWAKLKAHSIESLPNVIPHLFKIMKYQRLYVEPPGLITFAIATAFDKLLGVLSRFTGPYLVKLMTEITLFRAQGHSDLLASTVKNKFRDLEVTMTNLLEARVLIPAILETYEHLIEKRAFNALGYLMEILSGHIGILTGVEIEANSDQLRNFFVKALEFRDGGLTSFSETNAVERQIIKALASLALKLTESGFRPFYTSLYSWAVENPERPERILTFYSVSCQLAESLKSLFVVFAGLTVTKAAEMLDACHNVKNDRSCFEEDEKNVMLIEVILKTLSAVFKYDSSKFVTKERFKIVMQPLVDQLENSVGGLDALTVRNEALLTPCVVLFTVATGDDSLWKEMNYQILLKMRNATPEIRLNALFCLKSVVQKIGDDFLTLLPETVTFLNELMEDEDEAVEKACKIAVQEMGKVLGEPLHKYFS